jgi:hypothetical protein
MAISADKKKEVGVTHFIALAEAIFENAINQVGNVGQAFILTELQEKSLDVLVQIIPGSRQKPTKSTFRSLFVYCIGPEKYNAVSIIIDEMIVNLVEAWDDSTLQDSRDKVKTFLKYGPEQFLTASPSILAKSWAQRARLTRGLL